MNNDIVKLLIVKFPQIEIINNKIWGNNEICDILEFLKNCPDLYFDMLVSIIAVDYIEFIELSYILLSSEYNDMLSISVKVNDIAQSVINIYPSAYFDECEIYDMFGVNFIGNKNLRRLFMPESWQGYPLRKNYTMNDERLTWNG